jgi:hypothetical protein
MHLPIKRAAALFIIAQGRLDDQFLPWRKSPHDDPTTGLYSFLVQGVIDLFAFFARLDQASVPEDAQVVRNGGLAQADLIHDVAHAQLPTADDFHDSLARLIAQCFGKLNRVVHIALLNRYISIYQL